MTADDVRVQNMEVSTDSLSSLTHCSLFVRSFALQCHLSRISHGRSVAQRVGWTRMPLFRHGVAYFKGVGGVGECMTELYGNAYSARAQDGPQDMERN